MCRKDDGGELWNYIIGAAVGGLISGLTTYKQTGDVKQALISGAIGAVNGAIAATGWHFLVQAGVSAATSFAGDIAMQRLGEGSNKIYWKRAIHNGILGGVLSIVGSGFGSLTSYFRADIGKELLTCADSLAESALKKSSHVLLNQAFNLLDQSVRQTNIARGISSVTGSILTWAPGLEFSM